MIVRVTETEFETEDGRVYPHPIPFPKDEIPSVAEFQIQYDRFRILFDQLLEKESDVR